MTPPRTIRRSSARDLPPSADSYVPAVVSQPAGRALPAKGAIVEVKTFSGVVVRARIVSVDPVTDGWIAWGEVLSGSEAELLAAGVPPCGPMDLIRIFSWQVFQSGDI